MHAYRTNSRQDYRQECIMTLLKATQTAILTITLCDLQVRIPVFFLQMRFDFLRLGRYS